MARHAAGGVGVIGVDDDLVVPNGAPQPDQFGGIVDDAAHLVAQSVRRSRSVDPDDAVGPVIGSRPRRNRRDPHLCFLRADLLGKPDRAEAAVVKLSFVIDGNVVAGDFDYFLKIRVRDNADQLLRLPAVRQARTFFVLDEVIDNAPVEF